MHEYSVNSVQRQVTRVSRSVGPAGSETWLRPTGWLVNTWAYVACVNMAGGENVDVCVVVSGCLSDAFHLRESEVQNTTAPNKGSLG